VIPAVSALIGRDEELARVGAFLDSLTSGPAALVLEGEAGIGKTSIWRAGVADATSRGYRVLFARPAEAERELSFCALGDLLGGVADEIGALPEIHRRALWIALGLEAPDGQPPEQRIIGLGVLGLLRRLSEERPVLVALDDLQWLDPPSAAVLQQALRRLDWDRVGLFAAARVGHEPTIALEGTERLRVSRLSLEALDGILRAHLGTQFLRPTLVRIERTSEGNPLYAVELGRALLDRSEPLDPNEALPVPENLRQLLRTRLDQLSDDTREALLSAAVLARPSEETVCEATGETGWLTEALAAGVIERAGPLVRFTHPLLPSALLADAPLVARRRVHSRLAEIVDDLEERARHLAAAARGPDEAAAAALDAAAAHAAGRGAADAAGELAELAFRLTTPEQRTDAHRRLVEAARYHNMGGNVARTIGLLEPALAGADDGRERAQLLFELAEARASGSVTEWRITLELALDAVGQADDALRARIHLGLASIDASELRDDTSHVEAARALAETLGDPNLLAAAITREAWHAIYRGREPDAEALRAAAALQDETGEVWWEDAQYLLALQLCFTDQLDEGRVAFTRYAERAREAGVWPAELLTAGALVGVEVGTANWEAAERRLAQLKEMTLQTGHTGEDAWIASTEAAIHLFRGRVDEARAAAERGRALAEHAGTVRYSYFCEQGLGEIAAALGDAEEAHRRFEACIDGVEIPMQQNSLLETNDAEALTQLGRLDEAQARLDELESREIASPVARAAVKRACGLLSSARGEHDEAIALLQRAVQELEGVPRPVELGRTLLALGSVARRGLKRRVAREALERALELFERIETPLWAEKARRELAQIGGRRPSSGSLTETEQRIAELVASGRSNAQVARTLYVSPKTVEWNLSKIYRKLHVTSRTELAAKLARSRG
jgi:DNA-binding CsgD family transcriptional regulator